MKVSLNTFSSVYVAPKENSTKKKNNFLKFLNFKSAYTVSSNLARKGIKTEFLNNNFFARCAEQTVEIFETLFGRASLPKSIRYTELPEGVYGEYQPTLKEIRYNSRMEEMRSMDGLKRLANQGHNFLIPNDFSSLHRAHTHVHEFAHRAHHSHLDTMHSNSGIRIMEKLRYTQIPTAIGRLITRFKLGNYALDEGGGMNEFMAERIAQDICNKLTDEYWYLFGEVDVKYSDIFNRKWDYRYSRPQAYLDYFTQQVWNGNIEEAKRAGDKVEEYLAELDAPRIPKIISEVAEKVGPIGIVPSLIGGASSIFESFTNKLDRRNRLIIRE